MNGTIVLAGSVAQKLSHGGHAWVFLQYLLGFRRLGWDVLLVDRVPEAAGTSDLRAFNRAATGLAELMNGFDLGGQWSLRDDATGATAGLSLAEVVERTRQSAVLINVMGYCTAPDILSAAPKRVFLDIDPGFPQMWHELQLTDVFSNHDAFVTIGENVGHLGCTVPTCGLAWVPTPQPVVLDQWPVQTAPGRAATSVATWRGAYGPVDYREQRYGLRVHEFRRFVDLAASSPLPIEMALSIDAGDERDLQVLRAAGWRLLDPAAVAGDVSAYRRFVQGSAAELMVAKNMYVRSRSGWFSDRSLCYLASGRPVVAQDTGFSEHYPTGLGLFRFETLEEARDALDEVASEPAKHGQAARELAEAYFDSDLVLSRLLSRLGVS